MKNIVATWAAACALGSPCVVLAQDKDTYHAEAGLNYYRIHADTTRVSGIGVLGAYYFDALPRLPQDYPLEQGPFVERAASVAATYDRTSQSSDNFQTAHGSSYGAAFVFRRPDMPLYIAASYQQTDFGKFRSSTGSSESDLDAKSYQLIAGAYLGKTTLLALDWEKFTTRSSSTTSFGTFEGKSDDVGVGISVRHLAKLPNGDHLALTPRVAQTREEQAGLPTKKNHSLSLLGTYYPTKMLGLNFGYAYDRGDDRDREGAIWRAGVRWFVVPTISLSLDVQQFRAKAPNSDNDMVMLGAQVRF